MKQCPECNEVFDDHKAFCDMDGSTLLDQTDSIREALSNANGSSGSSSAWVTGAIGGFVGIVLCVLLYIGFLAPSREDLEDQDRRPTQTKETAPARSGQVAIAPAQLNSQMPATETASPSETESPTKAEPSPTASPAAPATTPVPPAALNSGPIATGGRSLAGGERAIIKLKDGSSVEADAAWEDAQGVWFRRSGLVSFVERSRVEAITEAAQRRPPTPEVKTP